MAKQKLNREKNVLVLQGGGALGAYQAGAYEALSAAGIEPDWVAGISIGAVNAAIIAGNRPEHRRPRLREFWNIVSSRLTLPPIAIDDNSRKLFNETSAAIVASTGAPGFFTPRYPPAVFNLPGTMDAISLYDTYPLKETLLELVDFDILNSSAVQYSIGAVEVDTGNLKYFDSRHDTITPEHIMASGALPPGFPPVEINGKLYWDGGIVSNTPLQYILDGGLPRDDMTIFQIDLFSARGPIPKTLFDVQMREKEIRYSSRTRLNTDYFKVLQSLRRAVRRLDSLVSDEIKAGFDWKLLSSFSCNAAITLVHLIHRRAAYSTQSNDYEFSRYTINEHWQAGRADVESTLGSDAWKNREPPKDGVLVLDCTKQLQPPAMENADENRRRP
ncbi:Putative patatin-like phospholipase [Hyphomicrobium sp. GJ21]|uniref:patatin-like phospholipase family protein n=1 Tax=Hyphomicrobium sp. GJ21 TaxID=113574 RepID=UPI000622BC60|nr:patatin-like phospholipase family protein [Hyphomicrobium sp. GJ21]CEJ84299.1 Putative patatin-like phospholipase [Hyphomicrobium sp. GJ21]